MAFSTQKDFFYVPFMNESVDFVCKRACVQLKSYDSTIDDRSWAMDETKQSKFLTDLVTCGTPIGGAGGGAGGTDSRFPGAGLLGEQKDGLRVGDSVLECANTTLGQLQNMLLEKQKQLELSNERLKTADEENKRIKDIMSRKYDSSHSKDFYNKIQKLASGGKLSKSEEQELLHIYQKIEDMNKAYEVLQAENSYMKRLLEKMSRRATLESIKQEPEKSTDIQYLQSTVNALRKEVTMLRKFEDAKLKERQRDDEENSGGGRRLTDRDAENLKAIIRERNALREKCKTFKELESKVQELQRKSKAADNLSENLSNNLDNQSKYIGNVEKEMKRMQNYYEDEMQKAKYSEQLLKCQLDSLKEDLMQAKIEAQKSEVLQMEVACLRNEITKREVALSDYDCQYKQLMRVIEELQGSVVQNLNDTQTQTCNDFVEDLAFFASATLEEITKELDKCGAANRDSYSEIHAFREGDRRGSSSYRKSSYSKTNSHLNGTAEECCREKERLQKMVQELKAEKDRAKDCDAMCADALKKLEKLELENLSLKQENLSFQGRVYEGSMRLNDMSNQLGRLDDSVKKTGDDTTAMAKDLRESLKLVKDISDIQLKNEQLTSAVNAISTKEGQQMIDDLRAQLEALRRQLRDEQEKNKKCQEENDNLQKELKQRGLDIAKLTNDLQAAQAKGAANPGKPGAANAPAPTAAAPTSSAAAPAVATPPGSAPPPASAQPSTSAQPPASAQPPTSTIPPNAAAAPDTASPIPPPTAAAPVTATIDGTKGDSKRKAPGVPSSGKGSDGGSSPLSTVRGATGGAGSRGPTPGKNTPRSGKGKRGSTTDGSFDPYQDFVNKNATDMNINLKAGNCLEKELRKILEAFIKECGFCFCHCKVPKSKFYAICYKILHEGIQTISFRELVYVHKKVFIAADKLHPGCLLNIVISEQKGPEGDRLKCCSCKNILCCDNSEEMLREKVYKLEHDIEMARQYLEHFKTMPDQAVDEKTFRAEDHDSNYYSKTIRQSKCSPRCSNKQLKQLKARIMKCSDLLR